MAAWGTPEEVERRRRIRVAVWAYAYEKLDYSLVSDEQFDRECKLVDLTKSTGNAKMDKWFKANFADYTGQWVHKHPNPRRLEQIALAVIRSRNPQKDLFS